MYIIEIKDGKNKTYFCRKTLYQMGFRFRKADKVWYLKTEEIRIPEYKEFAKEHKLICNVYKESYERDNTYRQRFFTEVKPHFHGKYFCAYCGELLFPEEVSVDHVIPVRKAKKNLFTQNLLKAMRIEDINDIRNLAPACIYCNSKKSYKIGLWTIRGYIGKHKYFWFFVYILFFLQILLLITFILIW